MTQRWKNNNIRLARGGSREQEGVVTPPKTNEERGAIHIRLLRRRNKRIAKRME